MIAGTDAATPLKNAMPRRQVVKPPPARTATAPEYALSGRSEELSKTVLAQSPMGPITALDVLMFDDLTSRGIAKIDLEVLLSPKAVENENEIPAVRSEVEDLVALEAVARRAGSWQPAADRLRVMTFGAAEAAWIQQTVVPQVKVLDPDINRYYLAHPEKYIHQQRIQVRYIFNAVGKSTDITSQTEAQAKARSTLDALATQIRGGGMTFEEAARKNSEADSAREGGLLPPFNRGDFFPEFENQAYGLDTPGQMSPIFDGPGGVYLLQLVQKWPMRNIPIEEVAGEIRTELQHDHVRHYYPDMLDKIMAKHVSRNSAPWWDYIDHAVPIAQYGKAQLSREDLMRFYGDPTDTKFQTRFEVVSSGTAGWMEGEAIMQDIEKRGMADHQWIQRARELATIRLRADHVLAQEAPPASYATVQAARAALQAHPDYMKSLRAVHLLRFSVRTETDPKMTPSRERSAVRLAQALDAQVGEGFAPTSPEPLRLATRVAATPPGDDAAFLRLMKELDTAVGGKQWPDVHMDVTDAGWQAIMPGSPWSRLLVGKGRGDVSAAQPAGKITFRYLIVEDKPLDLKPYESQPLVLQSLAVQAESRAIVQHEIDALRQSGSIKYDF